MATKKSSSKKKVPKTIMQKISVTASYLKDEFVSGKDHLVEVAGDAVESIKTSIHKITHTGKVAKKSAMVKAKTAVKKPVKKTIKRVAVKKIAPVKKITAVKRK